jgi:hypothetical protein
MPIIDHTCEHQPGMKSNENSRYMTNSIDIPLSNTKTYTLALTLTRA